jgi:hypothetical protein
LSTLRSDYNTEELLLYKSMQSMTNTLHNKVENY